MGSLYRENIDVVVYLTGEINARKCKNFNFFFKELDSTFLCTNNGYYSCDDAFYDMSYYEEKNYKIIINKFRTLDDNIKELIQSVMNGYAKYWNEIRENRGNKSENNFIVEYR